MRKLELLSPAGDMERLKMAILYGADAVYLAGTDFGMRAFAGNFTPEELPIAVKYAHDHVVSGHGVHSNVNLYTVIMGIFDGYGQFLGSEITREGTHAEGSAGQIHRIGTIKNGHFQPFHISGRT